MCKIVVVLMTCVFLVGAGIGHYYIIESPKWYRYIMYLVGGIIWYAVTYAWWAEKLFKIGLR